jgi:acyl-CoA thioester hydrolase
MDITNLPDRSLFNHSVDVQIRFNDVDILGHLNNTVYFSFYDTGKAYYFEHILGEKMNWQKVETVIANIECAYIAPIYFGEQIAVLTRCISISEKSFRLQQMLVEKSTGEVKSLSETVMVSYDVEARKSKPLSEKYRKALTEN